jgi:ATP-binding cassette subfamily B protein
MRKRGSLDQKKFHEASINQNSLIETLYGMTEIKLNGAELWRQHDWKRGQLRLFTINNELGKLSQLQDSGGLLINESKNLIITCMAALSVISGEVSLGMMLAIQFMIGQLNIPINEFITFAREYQDAKISADRIQEVHELPNEEQSNRIELKEKVKNRIAFKSVSFAYQGRNGTEVLSNVNFEIPIGKVTAIVGTSGSGKTTLIKLLLKFYEPSEGLIMIDDLELRNLSTKVWRAKCSVVLQDGFLFSGSVLRNITMNESVVDKDRVTNAAKISNSHSFIEELPEGFETRIGLNGVGLSHGQRQRILLARAIYKESEILILDEATSALDSINEKQIKDNLRQLNPNKTVIIIAHRLSTVLNADNIIVVDKGSIVETGTHSYLFRNQGKYYELINNQLNS